MCWGCRSSPRSSGCLGKSPGHLLRSFVRPGVEGRSDTDRKSHESPECRQTDQFHSRSRRNQAPSAFPLVSTTLASSPGGGAGRVRVEIRWQGRKESNLQMSVQDMRVSCWLEPSLPRASAEADPDLASGWALQCPAPLDGGDEGTRTPECWFCKPVP